MSNHNQPLLIELTSEQAATVEGGLALKIHSIQCLKAGADGLFGGNDDLFVQADGNLLHGGVFSMKAGRNTELNLQFSNNRDSVAIDLFDNDFTSKDDFLGGFVARSTGGQIFTKQVSGSGSRYRIFYSAV